MNKLKYTAYINCGNININCDLISYTIEENGVVVMETTDNNILKTHISNVIIKGEYLNS